MVSEVAYNADMDRYFEGGISSVYLWDMDDGFAGCVLLKKGTYGLATAHSKINMDSRLAHIIQLW
jgi:hypothetical protein